MFNVEFEIESLKETVRYIVRIPARGVLFAAGALCVVYFVPLLGFKSDITWLSYPNFLANYRIVLAVILFILAFSLGFRFLFGLGDIGTRGRSADLGACILCLTLFAGLKFGPEPTVGFSGGFPGQGTTTPPAPPTPPSTPGDPPIITDVIVPPPVVPLPVIIAPPESACPTASASVTPVFGLTAFATACYAEAGCSATATICRRGNSDGPDSLLCATEPGLRIDEDTRRNIVNVAAGKGCFADAFAWLSRTANRQQRSDRMITLLGQACPDGWTPPVGDPAFDQLTTLFGAPIRCPEVPMQ